MVAFGPANYCLTSNDWRTTTDAVSRTLKFAAALVFGLGVLAYVAYYGVTQTTRTWFERDVALRADVIVTSARQSLVRRWADRELLTELLDELTRDERIMGAAACYLDRSVAATTPSFPQEVSCRTTWPEDPSVPSFGTRELPGGTVHVSAVPVRDGDVQIGALIIVHDMSFVGRREAATRNMMLIGFGVLAIGAALLTFVAARLSWRGWTRELTAALRGEARRPQFQPLLRDVRELVAQLRDDAEPDGATPRWTPQRLRSVLKQHLEDERIIVVSNREPYIHERTAEGSIRVQHPASGLVTALEPVMRACSGTWVAHGSGGADRETVDERNRVRVPPNEESYTLRRVWLTEEEEKGYYYGVANEGLWPLCHLAHNRPRFSAEDWAHYRAVNERFAQAVCAEAEEDDPIILVQDYHLALAPRFIRARLPRATILTFWHIPWPNAESFGVCPFREELLDGLLGSSIVGFHTQQHCNNFVESVDAFVESRIDREHHAVIQRNHRTRVRPYPISIEWPVHWLEDLPSAEACRAQTFRELGLKDDALLGVGIDRMDYTKGIEERLLAVERMLELHPEYRGRFSFAQLAAPSRTRIERYQRLDEAVEQTAERINQRFGTGDYKPILLLRAHHEPPKVYQYYRAADLCYVSSLHDGMNLVAKEFVAARSDERGVLVLSQFTGAARELTEALVVNPYDLEQASSAIAAALAMPVDDQRARMRSMRTLVREFNVYRWAGRMLVDAAELRRKERLNGNLGNSVPPGAVRESIHPFLFPSSAHTTPLPKAPVPKVSQSRSSLE